MKPKSRFSRNVYAISDIMWYNKHLTLRHTTTENMKTMGKVDTSDLIMIITWANMSHLNWNGPVEHIQPHI